MKTELSIDIWYNGPEGTPEAGGVLAYECLKDVRTGKALMIFLRSQGRADIRMYVRAEDGTTGSNRIYFFKDGEIVLEKDNYTN